jgi:rRNA maturation RNase YbeY
MDIRYKSVDRDVPKVIKRRETSEWIRWTATRYQRQIGEIIFIFCSDDEILRLNNQYLGHDYYTDIITFDYSEGDLLSGDLFISVDTVQSNAVQYQTDYAEELLRVMIHGVLHLCGLKDKSPDDAKLMRESENEALSRYGI